MLTLANRRYRHANKHLWSVDEYVMKSEMPRLLPIIERATRPRRLARRSNKQCQRIGAAA
jgi:hypothetical protein